MRHLLDPTHVRPRRGSAHGYELKHPVARGLPAGSPIRVWWQGREVSRPATSVREVEKEGGGRTFFEPPYAWLSLPGDVDPATAGEVLLDVAIESAEAPGGWVDPGPVESARPLLIVCQQRSGSTALLYALGEAGPYRGPTQLTIATETEGYWLWRCLLEGLLDPGVSPFGAGARGIDDLPGRSMGLAARSGFLETTLRETARQVHRSYSLLSCTRGTWIDKSPGYEVVPIAPLFAALFPKGRTLYLTRDPVPCVLSGMRLDGRSPEQTRSLSALKHAAEISARWCVSHYAWRRYCRPSLPPGSFLEIRATRMREQRRAVLEEVRSLLELDTGAEELERILDASPVPFHQAREGEYLPRVEAVIASLCRHEASAWEYEALHRASRVAALLRPWFRRRTAHMLRNLGLGAEEAERGARWLADGHEPAPAPRAGALLASWLADLG